MKEVFKQRIAIWSQLGRTLKDLATGREWPGFGSALNKDEFDAFQDMIETHHHSNGWFTPENIRRALLAWSDALNEANLTRWIGAYDLEDPADKKKIAIICAGNIPMVGFHDVLTVLITGHVAYIKLSSDDNKLIPAVLNIYAKLNPDESASYALADQILSGHQAVIATGSNNTSRYFNYYFRDIPHIIRKSRTSVAILRGNETPDELAQLGHDIFDYFGLGCRNVSKVFLPEGYDINKLIEAIYNFHPIINHNKYANNYDYNKAVWLLNRENLLDNGFMLFKQDDDSFASPTGSLYFGYYGNESVLKDMLATRAEELQCIVGKNEIPFGKSQSPQLWDYADHVDTVRFLSGLNG